MAPPYRSARLTRRRRDSPVQGEGCSALGAPLGRRRLSHVCATGALAQDLEIAGEWVHAARRSLVIRHFPVRRAADPHG